MALGAALGIGGAVLGGILGLGGSSSSNRAARRAASAQRRQVRDIAQFERVQRREQAGQVRARLAVLAADSGAVDVIRPMAPARSLADSLLEPARALLPGIPDPPAPAASQTPAATPADRRLDVARRLGLVGDDRTFQANGTGVLPFLPQPSQAPRRDEGGVVPSIEHIPEGLSVPVLAGSWEAMERSFTMQLIRDLFMLDRNLENEERAIDAGLRANLTNPLLAGLTGALSGAQAAIGIRQFGREFDLF